MRGLGMALGMGLMRGLGMGPGTDAHGPQHVVWWILRQGRVCEARGDRNVCGIWVWLWLLEVDGVGWGWGGARGWRRRGA